MDLSNIEKEYQDFMKNNTWLLIYYKIARENQQYNLTSIEARKPQNKHLNRYRDVNPYDHTRVKLNRTEKDYINANYVEVPCANRKYILTQGPLASTTGHFWLMIWEQCTSGIIMLNKLIEKKETKCHQYWPSEEGLESIYEDVNLSVTLLEEQNKNFYIVRKFKLKDLESSTVREVKQFHYITWPDFGVPKSPTQFIEFLNVVRSTGVLNTDVGPAIVHCSAGIGRSGTFCLVDSTLNSMEKEGVNNVDLKEILKLMRRQRMGLIQNTDQFRFSYQAIIEGIKRFDPDYKVQPEEERSDVEMSNTIHDDQSKAPPLPPRVASLDTCPKFGPLPPEPIDSSQEDLCSSSDSSDCASSSQTPTRFEENIENKEGEELQEEATLRLQTENSNSPMPLERLATPEPENATMAIWLSVSVAVGAMIVGFVYLNYNKTFTC